MAANPTPQSTDLHNYTFYINPVVMTEQAEIAKAFQDKELADGERKLYRLSFHVTLENPDLKSAAAARLKELFPKSTFDALNVKVIPYRFIQLWAKSKTGNIFPLLPFLKY